jgi:hypothetical protein
MTRSKKIANHTKRQRVYKRPNGTTSGNGTTLSCKKVLFTTLMMSWDSLNIYLTPSGQFIYTDSNEAPPQDHPISSDEVAQIFERHNVILHHDFKDDFSQLKAEIDELRYSYDFEELKYDLSPQMVRTVQSFVTDQLEALGAICELTEEVEPVFRRALELVTQAYFSQHNLTS